MDILFTKSGRKSAAILLELARAEAVSVADVQRRTGFAYWQCVDLLGNLEREGLVETTKVRMPSARWRFKRHPTRLTSKGRRLAAPLKTVWEITTEARK